MKLQQLRKKWGKSKENFSVQFTNNKLCLICVFATAKKFIKKKVKRRPARQCDWNLDSCGRETGNFQLIDSPCFTLQSEEMKEKVHMGWLRSEWPADYTQSATSEVEAISISCFLSNAILSVLLFLTSFTKWRRLVNRLENKCDMLAVSTVRNTTSIQPQTNFYTSRVKHLFPVL